MTTALTVLEREVIQLTAAHHWPQFHLDGSYTAPGRMIQMEGVRNGLGFVVEVSASRINHIELFTYGNQGWDGVEREWKIL